MVISSNMLQPSKSNDVNALSLIEGKENINRVRPAKNEFEKVFSRLSSSAAQPESKSLSVSSESEGLSGTSEDISTDGENQANEKSVDAKLNDLMPDQKKALTDKTEINSTPSVQLIQEVFRELKQVMDEKSAPIPASVSIETVIPVTIRELLQKLESTLSVAAKEKSASSVKNLVAQIKELKSALKKNDEMRDAGVPESSLAEPSTGNEKIPMVLLEQMEAMLGAAPATWTDYVLQQQQNQVVMQTSVTGQAIDVDVISEQESAYGVRMATSLSEAGNVKSVLERVPQQQTEAAGLVESTVSTPGEVLDPAEAKAVKADAFSSGPVDSPTEHTVAKKANASKPEISVKSSEHAEYTTIAMASRDTASKEKFSFTDGGTQHNAGEKGGNNSANPSPVTNASGFEFAVQNQDRSQVQPQAENSKAPLREHIMNQVKESLANFEPTSRGGTVTMKLNPEELGELTINMRMENLRLKVDVVAHNQMVKDTIMQNIDSLREALSRQNITMDRFDVSTGGGQGMNQAFREGRNTAGNIPYKAHSVTPAGTEEIVSPKNVYWEPNEARLLNVRF